MSNQKSTILGFIKWITNLYIDLEKKTIPYPCKLNGVTIKNDKQLAIISFAGGSYQIEIDPIALIEKDLFEYFSANDKKQLFAMAYNKNLLKLTDHYFSKETKSSMVVLKDNINNNRMTMAAENVLNIIEKIDSADSYRIGFLAGTNYSTRLMNDVSN